MGTEKKKRERASAASQGVGANDPPSYGEKAEDRPPPNFKTVKCLEVLTVRTTPTTH